MSITTVEGTIIEIECVRYCSNMQPYFLDVYTPVYFPIELTEKQGLKQELTISRVINSTVQHV
jgi:hypothetical protein